MEGKEIEEFTGEVFGYLWGIWRKNWPKLTKLFLKETGFSANWFKDKVCLDAGCGFGRAAYSLARLGAKKVYGVDIGERCVEETKKATNNLPNVKIIKGSVLNLSFGDNFFDFVYCSGVLGCVTDFDKGFQELSRVLKKGGVLFVGLYGKGGIFSALVNISRKIASFIPYRFTNLIFSPFFSPNLRVQALDYLYTPILKRFSEKEARGYFLKEGFGEVNRVSYYRYNYQALWAKAFFGEGWIEIKGKKR